jgi:bacterial/archaeal transporter family protein
MLRWFVPTLVYIVTVGALGVTSKLALRTLRWPDMILWSGLGYVFVAAVLLAIGQTRLQVVTGTPWAMLSAVMAIVGLVALYLALGTGDASKVIPITAAYPAVTLALSVVALSERVSLVRAAGTCLVMAGVVVVTAAR